MTNTATHRHGIATGYAHVQGACPACGWRALFLGEGGYVTCSVSDCPEPDAASKALDVPAQRQSAVQDAAEAARSRAIAFQERMSR